MEIRQLIPKDLDAVASLRLRALAQAPRAFRSTVEEEQVRGRELLSEALQADPSESAVFGAFKADSNIVGMLGVIRTEQRSKLRHRAMIWGVYVDTEHRGQGIAGRLLDAAIQHVRENMDVTMIYLSHDAASQSARRLYESRGFVRWGTEPKAMRIGAGYVDEDHMVLDLKP